MTDDQSVESLATNRATKPANRGVEWYECQKQDSDDRIAELEAVDQRYATIRLILFSAFVVGLAFAIATHHAFWMLIAGISLAGFLVAVIRNESLREKLDALRANQATLNRLIARCNRDWDYLDKDLLNRHQDHIQLSPKQSTLAGDLDLFGRTSLFSLVSMAGTQAGASTLGRWLSSSSLPNEAAERHQIAGLLAENRNLRLRFYTLVRQVGCQTDDPSSFVRWATGPTWLKSKPVIQAWPAVSAVMFTAILATGLYRGWNSGFGLGAQFITVGLILLAILNLVLAAVFLTPIAQIFATAIASRRSVGDLQVLLDSAQPLASLASEEAATNHVAQKIFDCLLGDTNASAKQGFAELATVAKWVNLKQSASTFLPYILLQSWFLWDIHALRKLERWQEKHGPHAGGWLEALAELDALMSLAALVDDHPSWTTPIWQPYQAESVSGATSHVVSSKAIGHPLLRESDRVDNDVTIGPPGSFLLVTGSNMSGKSTMLRSVGLNTCLAMAGGPVCANELRLPAIELATSIRVSDNLGDGVSYYMAELHRLADVVEHAKSLAESDRVTQLFLLDEILQGTNSRERQIAVARVLRHLSHCGSIGAITTHDLELADEPEMNERAVPVHFRETVRPDADGNDRMTFDYCMRDGICPTTNALRLLELVGLREDLS